MSSAMSKRSQARNEKALQELIKSVPGNERCADCQARNPGWASWSLGIFLCMRCAALHRKLGTHLSKVKSLSMDTWTNDQVENMKKTGNATSNQKFNPKNTRPSVPIDTDEVDSAMERFIRQKYEQRIYSTDAAPSRVQTSRAHTGGTVSSDDQPPPPPPPKTGRRFGFGLRSSSSAQVLPRNSSAPAPIQVNKPRVFGAAMGIQEEGMEWKLVTLKEMGFRDDKRNSSVLKGLNGDLERAIESLVRLGEGPGPTRAQSTPFPESRSTTPGISTRSQPQSAGPIQSSISSNPWQTQAQRSGHSSPPQSASSYNPFENISTPAAPVQQSSLDSAFQNLNIGQQQQQQQQQQLPMQAQAQPQPLFPNSTGGYPQHQEHLRQARLQQSMTPPIPQIPQQFHYNNPYGHQQNYNPFVNAVPQQTPVSPSNPFLNNQQNIGSQDPYMNQTNMNAILASPTQIQYQQPTHNPWMQQQQQQPQFQQNMQQSPAQYFNPQSFSPIANGLTPTANQMPYQNLQQPQMQPLMAQPTGRADKSSILALYNYPQLAPQIPQQDANNPPATAISPLPPAAKLPPGVAPSPQRSVTMPVSGSKNPFLPSGGMAGPARLPSHAPQESINSGRHSPDAFASLSARFV